MTYLQIRTEVQYQLLDQSTGAGTIEDKVKTWVNKAYRDTMYDPRFDFLDASSTKLTVSGTQTYDLATDVATLTNIRIEANKVNLIHKSPVEFDQMFPDQTTSTALSGLPRYYMQFANAAVATPTIKVQPVPNAVYTMTYRYKKILADLSSDGDLPAFPLNFHQILIDGALIWGYKYQQDQVGMAASRKDFETGLKKMQIELGMAHKADYLPKFVPVGSIDVVRFPVL